MTDSELLEQIGRQREINGQKIRTEIGDILDAADLLHHYVEQWYLFIWGLRPMPESMMEVPAVSREFTLQKMVQEMMETSYDLYHALRIGLSRPAQWMLRKQFEIWVNANFFKLDESGDSAFRYQHWQLAAASKLNPDDPRIQGPLAHSLKLFGDSLKDRTGKNQGKWAKAPNGKVYADLISRANFVAKNIRDTCPCEEASERDWNRITEHDIEMYKNANTVVHPSMIGRLSMSDFPLILVSNNLSLANVLHTYREIVLLKLSLSALVHEDLKWLRLADAYGNLSATIVARLNKGADC